MTTSKIEWTERTLNPTTGCREITSGCDNCYARPMTERLQRMGNPKYAAGFDTIALHPDTLDIPRRRRQPTVYFVNSMSDLFHKDIPRDYLVQVWEMMLETPRHIYQILTKRQEIMRERIVALDLPLPPNIWLGVSVEEQKYAANRIPALLELQPAVAFISAEPLLELIDLTPWLDQLDWVICGAESGPADKRRPFDIGWARSLRNQCAAFGVPYFYKQGSGRWPGKNRLLDGEYHNGRPHIRCGCQDYTSTLHAGAVSCPRRGGQESAYCYECGGCKFCRLVIEGEPVAMAAA